MKPIYLVGDAILADKVIQCMRKDAGSYGLYQYSLEFRFWEDEARTIEAPNKWFIVVKPRQPVYGGMQSYYTDEARQERDWLHFLSFVSGIVLGLTHSD